MANLIAPTHLTVTRRESREEEPLSQSAVPEPVTAARAFGMHNAVWMLMVSALAARLAAVLLRGDFSPAAAGEFGSLAAGLLEGNGFAFNETAIYTQHGIYEPSSVQPPVYPLLLAGFYWFLGVKASAAHVAVMLLNTLLGAATVPITYAAARRIGAAHAVGLCAAALLAFWPTQIFAATLLHPLALITLLAVASVTMYYRALDSQGICASILFGLLATVAALTEPLLLPALATAPLLMLFARELPISVRVRNALLIVACATVLIGPWTFRNWRVHGAFEPVTGTFWSNLWKGNNSNSAGTDRPMLTPDQHQRYWSDGHDGLRQFDLLSDEQRQALDGKRTAEREALWRQWALAYIRENPARYAQLCAIRLSRTVWAEWNDPRSRDPYFIYFATRSLLLAGTVAGLVLALRQSWRLGWATTLAGAIVLLCTLTVTAARCPIPLEPLQLILVSLALLAAWQRVSGRTQRPPIVQRFARGINDGASPASIGLQD